MSFSGRGRAAGSESILLFQDDWIGEKEATNALREFLMLKAVKMIRAKGDQLFRDAVSKEQQKQYKDRCLARRLEAERRRRLGGKT